MSCNLLDFSKSGGCGCKLDPVKLKALLSNLSAEDADKLLIDFVDKDDAAVLEINSGLCLIQTVDFFLPFLANPFDFGRIAAANALSDVYAMGGKPVMALSLVGWPTEKLPIDCVAEILKGAAMTCGEAGIHISGGHTIVSSDPIFGLSVNGIVEKKNLKTKKGSNSGDYIYISKALGIGILANAMKTNQLSEAGYLELISICGKLNILGLELGAMDTITSMTDITGFGLLVHLSEMLDGHQGAELTLSAIPVVEEARALAEKMVYPDITTNNYNAIKDTCVGLNGIEFLWLCDPQTNGGLLFTSSTKLERKDVYCIGRITESGKIHIL